MVYPATGALCLAVPARTGHLDYFLRITPAEPDKDRHLCFVKLSVDGTPAAHASAQPVFTGRTGGTLYNHRKNHQTARFCAAISTFDHFPSRLLLPDYALQLEIRLAGGVLHPVAGVRHACHCQDAEENSHESGGDRVASAERHNDGHEQSGDHQVVGRRAVFLRALGERLYTGDECPSDDYDQLRLPWFRASAGVAVHQWCHVVSGGLVYLARRIDAGYDSGLSRIGQRIHLSYQQDD